MPFVPILLIIITLSSCVSGNSGLEIKEQIEIPSFQQCLETMDLKTRQGYLAIVNIPGTVLTADTAAWLRKSRAMGIILFGYNIINAAQLKKFTSDLRRMVHPDLLIGIDHEGGSIIRIKWDKYAALSGQALGRMNDPVFAYHVAYERSRMLMDLGINMVFGPVADIPDSPKSYIYRRCFGTNPAVVSRFTDAVVRAQRDAGIITVLKHFPGHGKTQVNSHRRFPVINRSVDRLWKTDLLPFETGIRSGAEIVMLGHIINRNIDELPASLSRRYLDILRDMDFNGLVMTDDLSMTGRITNTIGWGLNIITGRLSDVERQIRRIDPDPETLRRVYSFIHFRNHPDYPAVPDSLLAAHYIKNCRKSLPEAK